MTTVRDLLARGTVWADRRLSVKQRVIGGDYVGDWTDITPYVIKWGTIKESFGDVNFLNDYQIDSSGLVLDNSIRMFNNERDFDSIFYGYSRIGSKLKTELFLYDDDGDEVAAITYYSFIYKNPFNGADNTISIDHAPYIKLMQLQSAEGIDTSAGTTAEIISRLVKKEVNGVRIFDKLFEGASDGDKYKINVAGDTVVSITSPVIDKGDTIWDKINDYALYDDFIVFVDSSGNFNYSSKAETDTVIFTLNGAGASTEEDGVNILSFEELDGTINFFPKITIEYGTSGNKVTSTTNWTPGDGSDIDIYGESILEPNKAFAELSQSEAQLIADNKRNEYGLQVRKEYKAQTIVPILNLKDKIQLNVFGEQLVDNAFTIEESAIGGDDPIGQNAGSFIIYNEVVKVIEKSSDLDNFKYEYRLREVG